MFTEAELSAKSKTELQEIAAGFSLDTSGTIAQLVQRIVAYYNEPKFVSGSTFEMEQLSGDLPMNSVFYNTETNKRYRKTSGGWSDIGAVT